MSELESDRIGKYHNKKLVIKTKSHSGKVLELDSINVGNCQTWKMS